MREKIFKRPNSDIQLGDATDNWDIVKLTVEEDDSLEDASEDLLGVVQTEHLADLMMDAMGIDPLEECDAEWH